MRLISNEELKFVSGGELQYPRLPTGDYDFGDLSGFFGDGEQIAIFSEFKMAAAFRREFTRQAEEAGFAVTSKTVVSDATGSVKTTVTFTLTSQ